MGANSSIEWTDHTFNPWWGCTKVSQGCKNCYAETLANRYGKDCWGPKGERRMMSEDYWRQPLKWDREAEKSGVRRRVFCGSMCDVFEGRDTMPAESWAAVEDARYGFYNRILETPNLDWLLLTKRPELVMDALSRIGFDRLPDNAWIGTSVEDQKMADERIPHLLRIPAKVRFLSCEPLLGPVDLREIYHSEWCDEEQGTYRTFALSGETIRADMDPGDTPFPGNPMIHWVICGGESGSNARPMDPDWARSLRDQCVQAGIPFFFKQWGEWIGKAQYDQIVAAIRKARGEA